MNHQTINQSEHVVIGNRVLQDTHYYLIKWANRPPQQATWLKITQSSAHQFQLSAHQPQLSAHQFQLNAHQPQLSAHQFQLNAHQPQLSAHQPQLNNHTNPLAPSRVYFDETFHAIRRAVDQYQSYQLTNSKHKVHDKQRKIKVADYQMLVGVSRQVSVLLNEREQQMAQMQYLGWVGDNWQGYLQYGNFDDDLIVAYEYEQIQQNNE